MKALILTLIPVIVLVFTGCASMKVNSDFDDTVNFTPYHTFAWLEQPDQVKDHLTRMGQITQHIEQAIERELQADGYQKADDTPDFFLVYHTSLERQITGATIDTWGYGYRRAGLRRGGVMMADVDVHAYQEGTLIIDIVDAKSNTLVWRGTASGAVNSPSQAEKKIDEAVRKILAEFPPAS